ncbi:MAG: flagellar hook-associated protein FlgK [bacterium]
MTSSLFGIYNAHRSLLMNQAALNLVNSNITNMNTEGYSKQRLEISQNVLGGSAPGTPLNAAQSGLGAYVDNISRNRDAFLDSYYRKETTTLGYYSELQNNNVMLEDITNELSNTGINSTLNDFYNAANQLNSNPTDTVARTDFAQKAENVALKLNHLYEQLNSFNQSAAGNPADPATLGQSQIGVTVTELNTKLQNLADLNNTIIVSTSQDITPNGLLDQRDLLLDQISQYIPITVKPGAGNVVNVSLGGNELVSGRVFTTRLEYELTDTAQQGNNTTNPAIIKLKNNTTNNTLIPNANAMLNSGKIGALLDLTETNSTSPNNVNGILGQLNNLARTFAKEVNDIQLSKDGNDNTLSLSMDKTTSPPTLTEATDYIFTSSDPTVADEVTTSDNYDNITAGNIKLNSNILSDPYKIAASKLTYDPTDTKYADKADFIAKNNTQTGDGSNIMLISQLRNKGITSLNGSTTENYVNTMLGKFGIQSGTVSDKLNAQTAVVDQIKQKRETAIGVNLDEELTDMVKYQRSYEASSKVFNVVNQVIQEMIKLGS